MENTRTFLYSVLIFSFFIVCYSFSHSALFSTPIFSRNTNETVSAETVIPPLLAEILSGEFKGIVAEFITLDLGARLGTKVVRVGPDEWVAIEPKVDWNQILKRFELSQRLDPYFLQTIMMAQGFLPWEGKVEAVNKLLEKAIKYRSWDWRPGHFLGFNHYYFLNQPGEAGKIFLETSKVPGTPAFLAILGARLSHKSGNTEAAIILMKSMLAGKTENDEGYQDIVDRLAALEGVRTIELARDKYELKFGRKPSGMNDLLQSGYLQENPDNPYGVDYCIDAQGKIYFDNPDCSSAQDN